MITSSSGGVSGILSTLLIGASSLLSPCQLSEFPHDLSHDFHEEWLEVSSHFAFFHLDESSQPSHSSLTRFLPQSLPCHFPPCHP